MFQASMVSITYSTVILITVYSPGHCTTGQISQLYLLHDACNN